jgi:erythromycin esterase-like protein
MWRNRAVEDLMARLRAFNEEVQDPARQVGFYGLDLYSLPSSMDAVEEFARRHDPAALEKIRGRYGCLAPWVDEPESYGALVRGPAANTCAAEVTSVIGEVLGARLGEIEIGDRAFFDAVMNARVVAASEAYYRADVRGFGRVMEAARHSHVRNAPAGDGSPWRWCQGGRLGSQQSHRRRSGHGHGGRGRDQPGPVGP